MNAIIFEYLHAFMAVISIATANGSIPPSTREFETHTACIEKKLDHEILSDLKHSRTFTRAIVRVGSGCADRFSLIKTVLAVDGSIRGVIAIEEDRQSIDYSAISRLTNHVFLHEHRPNPSLSFFGQSTVAGKSAAANPNTRNIRDYEYYDLAQVEKSVTRHIDVIGIWSVSDLPLANNFINEFGDAAVVVNLWCYAPSQ